MEKKIIPVEVGGEMNKQFLCNLSDWNNYNSCVCNIEEAITVLAEKKRDFSWAISELSAAIVKTTEERTREMVKLEAMGVENYEHALSLACKYL